LLTSSAAHPGATVLADELDARGRERIADGQTIGRRQAISASATSARLIVFTP
jgi:hypothetical protein